MKSAEMPSFPRSGAAAQTRSIYVRRLARLVRLRREFREDLNATGIGMLDASIRATYRDCIEFGAAEQARRLTASLDLDLAS